MFIDNYLTKMIKVAIDTYFFDQYSEKIVQ